MAYYAKIRPFGAKNAAFSLILYGD